LHQTEDEDGSASEEAVTVIERIGLIGLGTMGAAMARNVLKAGYPLWVYDIRTAAVKAMAQEGAHGCASCQEVATQTDAVMVMVPDSPDVEGVILGPGGVLAGAQPGSIILQMSTIDVVTTRKVAAEAAKCGVRMIDAPVCRSSQHAIEGKLMILLGGAKEDVAECEPLLRTVGDTLHHCGELGAGITMKLVNNALVQGIALAVCECLTLGVKAGLSLEQMIEVMRGTAASNRLMEAVYPASAFQGDYGLGFPLDWAHKDVGHTLSLATSLGSPCLGLALVHQLQNIARGQGKGRMDHSVLLTLFEELAGVQVRSDSIKPAAF
jgi:3-hydroxyisobutyrate dehydrogenase-like beta-hydroxyacid dehydrogenase